jgi:hypothetical protein
LELSRRIEEVRRDQEANAIWCGVYEELSREQDGLFGAVTSRAEAQVMRLALIYALLDESRVITGAHLKAALAVWEYCEASARYVFGDNIGNPIADEILRTLRAVTSGVSRTDLSNLFGRHRDSASIAQALDTLAARGLARSECVATGGRPAEVWFAS